MKLLRNDERREGKYRVWDVRKARFVIDDGPFERNEHFVIMLKDKYAQEALRAYALAAKKDDPEYAEQVWELMQRSGPDHPDCKTPD